MTSVKRLHYFDLPGLGEAIRFMLHYGGIKFEDMRYNYEQEWPEIRKTFPYEVLPVYEDGEGRVIHQSIAIMRYLAHKLNLLTGDTFEDARLDSIVLTIYDALRKVQDYYHEENEERRKEIKREFEEKIVDFFYSRLEKELIEHGGYFAGKLTWADFALVGIVETSEKIMEMDIASKYPAIQALIKNIKNIPAIKAFIANRKPYYVMN